MKSIHQTVAVTLAIGLAAWTGSSGPSTCRADEPPPGDGEDPAAAMKPYVAEVTGTSIAMPMVPIRGGTLTMGSPESEAGRKADEGPTVQVSIQPFWMGKYEVTWDEYDAFRAEYARLLDRRLDRATAPAPKWADAVSLPTPLWEQDSAPILEGLGSAGGYPVADISQFAARQFTKWLSKKTGHVYRLPTEAEWEFAARAGTTNAYFFGDDPASLGDYAWTFDNSAYDDPDRGYPGVGSGYRKVGKKKANPWGLHDVYGNVAEWVIDGYDAKAYEELAGRKKTLSFREAVRWPTAVFPCVVRGGSWESDPEDCRSAARLASTRKWQRRDPQIPKSIWWLTDAFHVGFRVVRPLDASDASTPKYWESDAEVIQDVLTEGAKQLRAPIDRAPGGAPK